MKKITIMLLLIVTLFSCKTYELHYKYKVGDIVYVRMTKYIVWNHATGKRDFSPIPMYGLKSYGCDEKNIYDCIIAITEDRITPEPHFVP